MSAAPPFAALMRHLADAPPDWQAPVELRRRPGVRISALLADTLLDLGDAGLADADAQPFEQQASADQGWLQLLLVTLWLLHQPALQAALAADWNVKRRQRLLAFLQQDLRQRAPYLSADAAIGQAEGREELIRHLLAALQCLPADEDQRTFDYRLQARDSVGQAELVAKARAAEERARKLREAMARKAAEEAAMKYNRE